MINVFHWYRSWRGETKFLPRSERQGHEWVQGRLVPLQAQMAVFFGQPEATLKDLQEGVMKLHKQEPIICSVCERDIWKDKHKTDCEIVRQYKEVQEPPHSLYVSTKKPKAENRERKYRHVSEIHYDD